MIINDIISSKEHNNKTYQSIKSVLNRMSKTGVIYMGAGYCIGVSDMIQTALKQVNIQSRAVECSVLINNKSNNNLIFIGFDDINKVGEIDTHVVVVTETEPPFLIDGSITNKINGSIVVEEVPRLAALGDTNIIVELNTDLYSITYKEKSPHVALLLQDSILNRIKKDEEIFNSIQYLKKLNYFGIFLSLFAVVAVVNQIFRWFF